MFIYRLQKVFKVMEKDKWQDKVYDSTVSKRQSYKVDVFLSNGLLTACSAAAVASDRIDAPMNTPCCQSRASTTSGTPAGRLPPSKIAEIGTPSALSQSPSIIGHCSAGVQNLFKIKVTFIIDETKLYNHALSIIIEQIILKIFSNFGYFFILVTLKP